MSKLFSPLKLCDLTLRNRVVVSPMCMYSATDGIPNDWHLVHLGSRAVGGAGLVLTEATAVSPEGRISPYDTGLWNDAQEGAWSKIVRFVKSQGVPIGVQLAHAGRKAGTDAPWNGGKPLLSDKGGWSPIYAPSPIPFAPGYQTPTEMTPQQIGAAITAFAAAARRALDAGFDVIELHMAHGYLLHSFLSPLSNRRSDDYGGPLENRMRMPLAVVQAVRAVWPATHPLLVRISATDWVDGGWDIGQSIEFAKRLRPLGVDLIDCSTGGLIKDAKVPAKSGYQIPFAEGIRRQAGIPTGAVGLITDPQQAEDILTNDRADLVLIARELLRNPYWPLHAARALGDDVPWPKQYERAKPSPV